MESKAKEDDSIRASYARPHCREFLAFLNALGECANLLRHISKLLRRASAKVDARRISLLPRQSPCHAIRAMYG